MHEEDDFDDDEDMDDVEEDEEEDEQDDEEEEERQGAQPRRVGEAREPIYDVEGLHETLEDIGWTAEAPWDETQVITGKEEAQVEVRAPSEKRPQNHSNSPFSPDIVLIRISTTTWRVNWLFTTRPFLLPRTPFQSSSPWASSGSAPRTTMQRWQRRTSTWPR